MAIKVGINGFGRIGRVPREPEDDQIEVAIRALEEVRPPESDAYEEE